MKIDFNWTLAIARGHFSKRASCMQGEFCNGGIFKPTIRKFTLHAGALLKNCLSPIAKVQFKKRLLFFLLLQGGIAVCSANNPTLKIPESSLTPTFPSWAEVDEIKMIEQMIDATSRQLEMQKHLKEMILQFNQLRKEFIEGNQTKKHTASMVRTARQIYEIMMANHLDHLFAKDYLEELTFFSSIAGKNSVARP